MEETQQYTTTGVKLAATTMARIDNVMAKVAEVRQEVTGSMAKLTKQVESTISFKEWVAHDVALRAVQKAAMEQAAANSAALEAELFEPVVVIEGELENFEKDVDAAIEAMEARVAEAKADAMQSTTYTGSDAHIKQVTGFAPDEVNKYWDGKVTTSTSSYGYVRGRKFYKVKFNIVSPGYWSANSDEIFYACQALSIHLRRKDGIERDLRPPCNHWGHWKSGGLGQCVPIESSFFSHCGGGGYWEQNQACGGVPESYLRYTIGYEENRHNYDRHLVHNEHSNWHDWRDSQTASKWDSAMCTGGNQNFRV